MIIIISRITWEKLPDKIHHMWNYVFLSIVSCFPAISCLHKFSCLKSKGGKCEIEKISWIRSDCSCFKNMKTFADMFSMLLVVVGIVIYDVLKFYSTRSGWVCYFACVEVQNARRICVILFITSIIRDLLK